MSIAHILRSEEVDPTAGDGAVAAAETPTEEVADTTTDQAAEVEESPNEASGVEVPETKPEEVVTDAEIAEAIGAATSVAAEEPPAEDDEFKDVPASIIDYLPTAPKVELKDLDDAITEIEGDVTSGELPERTAAALKKALAAVKGLAAREITRERMIRRDTARASRAEKAREAAEAAHLDQAMTTAGIPASPQIRQMVEDQARKDIVALRAKVGNKKIDPTAFLKAVYAKTFPGVTPAATPKPKPTKSAPNPQWGKPPANGSAAPSNTHRPKQATADLEAAILRGENV